jgi:sugar lactone lactonase YvrE
MRFSIKLLALALVCLSTLCQASGLEIVHQFYGPMPTGVTVSRTGRIFVNCPRWGDPVDFTVAEIQSGKAVAYPSADINLPEIPKQADRFISVQSVVVNPRDRVWVLDTGSIEFQKVSYGGPKLVGIDLKRNKIISKIDVRLDLTRGSEGFASITDSGEQSPNGIIVVDLGSGKSWRRLANHPSVKPDPSFIPVIDGQEIWYVAPSGKKSRWASGSDGIAIDQARKLLYYCPLSSRPCPAWAIKAARRTALKPIWLAEVGQAVLPALVAIAKRSGPMPPNPLELQPESHAQHPA